MDAVVNFPVYAISVVDDSNLVVRAVKYMGHCCPSSDNAKPKFEYMTEYHVSKDTAAEASESLADRICSDATATAVDVNVAGLNAFAIEICFRALHDSVPNFTYSAKPEMLYELIAAANALKIDIKRFSPWFREWLFHRKNEKISVDMARQLLYPCFAFDHAEGFQRATSYLAYNLPSRICELNTTRHRHLELPRRVTGKSHLLPCNNPG